MTWAYEWESLWGDDPPGLPNVLLTSGSWTYEAFYRFPKGRVLSNANQSLARLSISGSISGSNTLDGIAPVLNCVAVSGSDSIYLYASPSATTSSINLLVLELTGADIFDGNQWNISFGRFRSDDPEEYLPDDVPKSFTSSSYFLRAGRAQNDKIVESYVTSSFFQESVISTDANYWSALVSGSNGPFISVGSQSLAETGGHALMSGSFSDIVRTVEFDGKVGHMRFWSKGLLEREWEEHVRNFKSLGVVNPLLNFNFVNELDTSWGRLRLDASTDQILTESNGSGELVIYDFAQSNLHMSGTGFEASSQIIKPETFYYSYISPKFDEASTINKVRARGYQDRSIALARGAKFGLAHQIPPNEEPFDDARFTIDFSIIDALDQDIINIFGTFEKLENVIGDPELMFSPDYPQLENLREIYFNRLTDKINLKSFFEFFKWFDRNIGHFIGALLPRKTKFRGVNFVIESHMLERPKFENLNNDQYLDLATERSSLKGSILLQQIVGKIKKF